MNLKRKQAKAGPVSKAQDWRWTTRFSWLALGCPIWTKALITMSQRVRAQGFTASSQINLSNKVGPVLAGRSRTGSHTILTWKGSPEHWGWTRGEWKTLPGFPKVLSSQKCPKFIPPTKPLPLFSKCPWYPELPNHSGSNMGGHHKVFLPLVLKILSHVYSNSPLPLPST